MTSSSSSDIRRITLLLNPDDKTDEKYIKLFIGDDKPQKSQGKKSRNTDITRRGRQLLSVVSLLKDAGLLDQLLALIEQGVDDKVGSLKTIIKAIQIAQILGSDSYDLPPIERPQPNPVDSMPSDSTAQATTTEEKAPAQEKRLEESVSPKPALPGVFNAGRRSN